MDPRLIVEGVEPPGGEAGSLEMFGRGLFPLVCAVGVLGGYALLGTCWLILKTRGALQIFGREVALPALILTGAALAAISVWTPMISPYVARRWFASGHLAVLWVLPAAACFFGWRLKKSLWEGRDSRPLLWAILLFLTGFTGIAVSVYPFIVPYRYTVLDAANDAAALRFAGVGVLIVLPITILYLSLAYRVFHGKVLERGEPDVASAPHIGARRTSVQPADLHMG